MDGQVRQRRSDLDWMRLSLVLAALLAACARALGARGSGTAVPAAVDLVGREAPDVARSPVSSRLCRQREPGTGQAGDARVSGRQGPATVRARGRGLTGRRAGHGCRTRGSRHCRQSPRVVPLVPARSLLPFSPPGPCSCRAFPAAGRRLVSGFASVISVPGVLQLAGILPAAAAASAGSPRYADTPGAVGLEHGFPRPGVPVRISPVQGAGPSRARCPAAVAFGRVLRGARGSGSRCPARDGAPPGRADRAARHGCLVACPLVCRDRSAPA